MLYCHPIQLCSNAEALKESKKREAFYRYSMKTPFIVGTLHSELCLKMLSRIFHTDHLRKPGSQMDAALISKSSSGSVYTHCRPQTSSLALPHKPSRPPRHDQYEISGLKKNPRELFYKIDLLEARLDSLPLSLLPSWWPLPVIATARHHAEGGVSHLSTSQRQHLLEESLAWASAIDVEWRSLKKYTSLIAAAKKEKRFIISSFHDFKTVPSLARLERMSLLAQEAGADLFKVACRVTHEHELLRLLAFQSMMPTDFPIACMGMGEGGKISRILLPLCGSWLSYGWLYKPQLSGQWSAEELTLLSRKFW
ncbi:MAG: type I 3-dehydroquinate dehydratase [Chthoniobacterales bacterium]|nr:type I 3-dehydroquinate dehydratase [Chthoniobacterales bacterium]